MWMQSLADKDKWSLSHIPGRESHAPHIKRLSKNSDGSYTFVVYRNNHYIDCSNDLEEAQDIAFEGKMRPDRILANENLRKYIKDTPKDVSAFAKLTKLQQQTLVDSYPWLVPRKSELEGKRGVKVDRISANRTDLLSKQEKQAVKAALPMDAKIKVPPGRANPKKEGSDAWSRWQLLFQHAGKTVGEFIAAHGNPTTLKNAVKSKHVIVEGME